MLKGERKAGRQGGRKIVRVREKRQGTTTQGSKKEEREGEALERRKRRQLESRQARRHSEAST